MDRSKELPSLLLDKRPSGNDLDEVKVKRIKVEHTFVTTCRLTKAARKKSVEKVVLCTELDPIILSKLALSVDDQGMRRNGVFKAVCKLSKSTVDNEHQHILSLEIDAKALENLNIPTVYESTTKQVIHTFKKALGL